MRLSSLWIIVAAGSIALAPNAAKADSAPNPRSQPVITLDQEVTDSNPAAFARRLGTLLGVELRLPASGFRRLTVPAGEWTASKLLNHVAKQFEDVTWTQEFEFRTRGRGRPEMPLAGSKLPITGAITLRTEPIPFGRAVAMIQEAAPCRVLVPDGMPSGHYRLAWKEAPLERVLVEAAAAGGLQVVPLVTFRTREEALDEALRNSTEQIDRETRQQSEVASRLQELYGTDPYSEDFPWENLDRSALSASLGRELDAEPSLVDTLMERIRLQGECNRAK